MPVVHGGLVTVVRGLQKATGIVHGVEPRGIDPNGNVTWCRDQFIYVWGTDYWDSLPDDATVTCFQCILRHREE